MYAPSTGSEARVRLRNIRGRGVPRVRALPCARDATGTAPVWPQPRASATRGDPDRAGGEAQPQARSGVRGACEEGRRSV